jgi:hypothetical protein
MSDTFTFSGWENITEVGGGFCFGMFLYCSGKDFTMGKKFNLPQNIRTIGRNGAKDRVPEWHQIPAYAFCTAMFGGCSGSSFNMNEVFTLPQSLAMTGAWFCSGMFRNCSGNAFTMGQAFNLPQNVTRIAEMGNENMMGHVCESMFYNCRGNAFTMNDIFQTPQNLAHGWVQTFSRMFFQCRGAAFNMNAIFTLPQGMKKSYSGLAQSMFYQCDGAAFTMGSAFKAPPNVVHAAGTGQNHLRGCFQRCNGAAFQVNDVFVFPTLTTSHLNATYNEPDEEGNDTIKNAGAYYQTFEGITKPQHRTAASIIGGNPVPAAPRNAFGIGFPDWSRIDAYWSG